MTDTNDWPDQPGVPLNPEREGAHRLRHSESGLERDALWLSGGTWLDGDGSFGIPHAAAFYTYLGPCLTPAEVEARVAQAKRDALEEAARVAEGKVYKERYRTWPWWLNRDGSEGNRSNDSDIVEHADKIAAAIRALKGEVNE
jgi:hypothetical protein